MENLNFVIRDFGMKPVSVWSSGGACTHSLPLKPRQAAFAMSLYCLSPGVLSGRGWGSFKA